LKDEAVDRSVWELPVEEHAGLS